jgi:putative membrane protein
VWGDHMMFGGFMWVFWIVVLVGLFFLIKWIVQQKPGNQKPEESALDVLKKRYARGEIDKDEFEQKKRELFSS